MPGEQLERIRTELTLRCAFCAGDAHVASDPPTVLHDWPACPEFLAMEPIPFLEACRAAARARAARAQVLQ